MHAFDIGTPQKIDAVGYAVKFVKHHTPDTGLDNQFGTLHTRRGCDIEGGAVGRVVAPRLPPHEARTAWSRRFHLRKHSRNPTEFR